MELFFEIACLCERSSPLKGTDLIKKQFKGGDKRALAELLQRFTVYNSECFSFLGVQPTIEDSGLESKIVFRSSNYIGAIPLRSPITGKQIGDFVVAPRFVGRDRFEDYIEILDLLGSDISPEVTDSLSLVSGRNFRPPFYLEAVKFISALENLVNHQWRRFDSLERSSGEPKGSVNWRRYAEYESDPLRRLQFPIRLNVLSEFHLEYAQLRYVFDICRNELLSAATPSRVKNVFRQRLMFLEKRLYFHKPQFVDSVQVRASDPPAVKECKLQANRILNRNLSESTAWRVDFNDVFEKFVQHIFGEFARLSGAQLSVNPRFRSRSKNHFAWELRALEPDAVLCIGDFAVLIDAKYKSHMFNKFESTELLREDFRRDLHQVFAYTSFAKNESKLGVLCYPSNELETKVTQFHNPLNDASNRIMLVGLPLTRSVVQDAVELIGEGIEHLRSNTRSH